MNGPVAELRHAQTSAAPFTGKQLWLLLLIAALGATLRLFRLGAWSFWVDEAHTWRDATLDIDAFWRSNQAFYPTTYLLLRAWIGQGLETLDEATLRLPFALCGAVSVPLLALVGRPLAGRSAALLAALFLALNPFHIYWSQNARGYALVFLATLLTVGAFWRGMERRSLPWLPLAAALGLLGMSCQPTAGLLFAPLCVYAFLVRREVNGKALWLAGGILAGGILAAELLSYVPPFSEFVRAKGGPGLSHLAQTLAFYFRPSLLLLAAVGGALLLQKKPAGRSLFLVLWAVLPVIVLAALGTNLVKVTARYAFCALPAVLLLCGSFCVRSGRWLLSLRTQDPRWSRVIKAVVLPAIVCLDMAAYDFLYFTVQRGDRGQWRQAADNLRLQAGEMPMLLLTVNEPTMQFYLRPWHYRSATMPPREARTEVVSIETYALAQRGGAQAWFQAMKERAAALELPLYVAFTLPELREKDPDRRLERLVQTEMELLCVLPVWVGPKDETIFVYRQREAR